MYVKEILIHARIKQKKREILFKDLIIDKILKDNAKKA